MSNPFLVGRFSPFFLGIVGKIPFFMGRFYQFSPVNRRHFRPGTDCEAGTAGTGRLWHPGEPVAGWACSGDFP